MYGRWPFTQTLFSSLSISPHSSLRCIGRSYLDSKLQSHHNQRRGFFICSCLVSHWVFCFLPMLTVITGISHGYVVGARGWEWSQFFEFKCEWQLAVCEIVPHAAPSLRRSEVRGEAGRLSSQRPRPNMLRTNAVERKRVQRHIATAQSYDS